jgi:SAM-dependent methyltransferase
MIANVEMAAAWDGPEGEHWAEHADHYEGTGPGHWDALVATGVLAPGTGVLDIGCGTGKSSRDAARLVAPGAVVGFDLSGPMLARARVAAADLDNLTFVQGDAQVHPFETETFDVAISVFGAMFFGDPVAAFTNIGKAVRPGGRLAVLAWQELARNGWLVDLRSALAVGRDLPAPPPSMPGPFGLADPDHVRDVLDAAGFSGVDLQPVAAPMRFGADAEDAYAFLSTVGMTKGLTQELDDGAKKQAFANLRDLLERRETSDGVLFDSASWLITATKG